MANTTFDGPVRSKNGFINLGPNAVKAELLATDFTVADRAGRLITMDPTGTPTALTFQQSMQMQMVHQLVQKVIQIMQTLLEQL